ncbi:MAG TPA: hypothetical protein VL093_06975 [Flavipsychrobacter sp.]|jgi:hypothetical protein|nr:hypothetical protein [Flavipsychrobacter sp.]
MQSKRENGGKPVVRAYTYKELMDIYNVSRKTLMSWLEPVREKIGKKRGRCLSPGQVEIIFEELGYPKNIGDDVI